MSSQNGSDRNGSGAVVLQKGAFREERVDIRILPWEEEFGWRMEEKFWEMFNRSEDPEGANRRWIIERDIPWDAVRTEPLPDDAALMIESFMAVEDYLPDFAEKGLSQYRKMIGLSNSQINWSYEELKHGRTLRLVLERSGARTRDQTREFRQGLARREWTVPYPTARQMLIYAAFQEKETQRNYQHLQDVLAKEGSLGAAQALKTIGRDEAFHHAYYKDIVKMFLEYDEVGTAQDIKTVAESFRMPAQHLMPNMEQRVRVMVRHKVFGKRQVRDEAIIPTIRAFGFRDGDELLSVAAAGPALDPSQITPLFKTSGSANGQAGHLIRLQRSEAPGAAGAPGGTPSEADSVSSGDSPNEGEMPGEGDLSAGETEGPERRGGSV